MTPVDLPPQVEEASAEDDRVRLLLDDLEELLVDGRTWFDAEVTYQKTRASFAGSSLGQAVAFGIGAAVFAVVLLIALSVGAIIALSPVVTPLGATAIVVFALGAIVMLLFAKAKGRWNDMRDAFRERNGA